MRRHTHTHSHAYTRARLAKRSPRAPKLIMHGEMVAPTPESCAKWCERLGVDKSNVDEYTWRAQAWQAGASGALRAEEVKWLEPMMRSIAMGRTAEVEARFHNWSERGMRSGRIVLKPDASEEALLRDLCCTKVEPADESASAPVLMKCGEFECVDASDQCELIDFYSCLAA